MHSDSTDNPFRNDDPFRAATLASTLLANGANRTDVLMHLAHAAQDRLGLDFSASILVLDQAGALRNGASPNLPADYLTAIDRIKPHPNIGTCAAAAATGKVVITTDFLADDKWAELRHLPLSLGYVAAWSVPIKAKDGRVMGTFAVYSRKRRQPTEDELAYMQSLAHAASVVLSTLAPPPSCIFARPKVGSLERQRPLHWTHKSEDRLYERKFFRAPQATVRLRPRAGPQDCNGR